MGTITLTKTRECTDGTHPTISITGDFTGTVNIYTLRLSRKGMTNAQLKNALTTGLTVTT